MKRIVITGAGGLVGSRILELFDGTFECFPLSSSELDITNIDSVHSVLKSISYDGVLHLAGYTNVDGAESESEKAYSINHIGTKNLVEVARDMHKEFTYISTDFVFDGKTQSPYTETSKPNPISIYGDSKYKGELDVLPYGMIVRISYPYRAQFDKKKDIVRILKSLLEAKKPLSMISDSIMVPTFIDDIANGLKYLLNNFTPEVFHLVGKDGMSPYELAKQIAKTFNLDTSLISKTTYSSYFTGKAKRPQFCSISSTKNTFYSMNTFEKGLHIIKNQLSIV